MDPKHDPIAIGAVSYLNTVPLIWGMMHGPQREAVRLEFDIPAVCAERLEADETRIGLVPVAEIARQGLEIVPGVGITCRGAVRSILLFSKVPWREIKSLTVDASSRTSVQLARIILRERYGVRPSITRHSPVLAEMLAHSDAALIIGDPALRLSPDSSGYDCLDLGEEWLRLTQLPFVFAAWAGKPGLPLQEFVGLTVGSHLFGQARIDDIVEHEYQRRGITKQLAHRYLTEHIGFTIGADEQRGLEVFLELADLRRTLVAAL